MPVKVGMDSRPRSSWTHLAAVGDSDNPLTDYDSTNTSQEQEQVANMRALHEAYKDLFRSGRHAGQKEFDFETQRRQRMDNSQNRSPEEAV